jgi:antitoxin YefM
MARTVPFSLARSELTKLLDEVIERHQHIVITRNGMPAAVMISPDDYEALQETVEVLQDAELMDSLRKSEADLKAGRVTKWSDVKRDLRLG